MSLIQSGTSTVIVTGRVTPIPALVSYLIFATPTAVHVARALLVRDTTARSWLRHRGFDPDANSVRDVRRFLLRFRWTRAAASALFYAAAVVAIAQLHVPLGILAGPYLIALLLVEATAPDPRRGRTRSASLTERRRDYFAPTRSLWFARALIAAGALTSVGAAVALGGSRLAWAHAVVMATGLVVLETALAVGARRALPEATEALALDTAMRVQTARTTVAAALLFGGIGFMYSTSLLQTSDPLNPVRVVLGLSAGFLVYAAVGIAIALSRPLSTWRPRVGT
jgi:hypothetical protein